MVSSVTSSLLVLSLSPFGPTLGRDSRMVVREGRSFGCGSTHPGAFQRHSWAIRNEGSAPLHLRTRFTSGRCGFSLWLGEDYQVEAGQSLDVWICSPSPGRAAAPYFAAVEILTNDPDCPRLRLRLVGLSLAEASP